MVQTKAKLLIAFCLNKAFAFSTNAYFGEIHQKRYRHRIIESNDSGNSRTMASTATDEPVVEGRDTRLSKDSSLTLLEHVNINIPNHSTVPFYMDILGMGLDPRRAHNIEKGEGTVWANCGASQFHLPYGDVPQVIPGRIGLLYESLQRLKERLEQAKSGEGSLSALSSCFKDYDVLSDSERGIQIRDNYGNLFCAKEMKGAGEYVIGQSQLKQPFVTKGSKDYEKKFGVDVVERYGRESTDCLGIEYVEFWVPRGVAPKIANFYESLFQASVSVIEDDGHQVAVVGFGRISKTGKARQSLLFRERDEALPPYDGHHIALYVGKSQGDYEHLFSKCEKAGIIWVNPRFSDKTVDLSGARKWKQFRFKDILDLTTGEKIFTLEHEVRSVEHGAWPGE